MTNVPFDLPSHAQRTLVDTGNVERVSASRLDGHCYVQRLSEIEDLDAWLDGPDNFIFGHNALLKQCPQCSIDRKERLRGEGLIKGRSPLRALDLFTGEIP